MWRKFMCRIGMHKRLHVIQSFGSGKHVGCPDCLKEWAMHDGMEVIVPWDHDFEVMYGVHLGYDIDAFRQRWIAAVTS